MTMCQILRIEARFRRSIGVLESKKEVIGGYGKET